MIYYLSKKSLLCSQVFRVCLVVLVYPVYTVNPVPLDVTVATDVKVYKANEVPEDSKDLQDHKDVPDLLVETVNPVLVDPRG